MVNNDDRIADSGPTGHTSREKIRKIIEGIISEACEKLNRQAAALRLEVNDLSNRLDARDKEIQTLRDEVASLKAAQERGLAAIKASSVKNFKQKEKANCAEKAYRKFFSGDNGLLYRLGHILSSFCQLSRKENPSENDMLKAFSPFINMTNNLTVLDSELSEIAQSAVAVPDIPIDELLLQGSTDDEEHFYTSLWQACETPLRRLCDQSRDDEFDAPGAYDALTADVKELLAGLRSCDIAVIPSPGCGFDMFFDNSEAENTPSRPLVMRKSNRYVYTRGLYNTLKPYTLWE